LYPSYKLFKSVFIAFLGQINQASKFVSVEWDSFAICSSFLLDKGEATSVTQKILFGIDLDNRSMYDGTNDQQ